MRQKLIGNVKEGFVFVLSAPAGTGKTTLVRMLSQEFSCIVESISCTTRPMRPNEVEGKDYYFLSKEEFAERVKDRDFLEYAQVFGYNYGTSREYVLQEQKGAITCFWSLTRKGLCSLKQPDFQGFLSLSAPPL